MRVRNEQTTQGFFTKFLVGEDLLSEMIFGPHLEQSQMEGGLLSGTESDEGGLENIVPYSKIRANFWYFKDKTELSDAVLSYKVVKIERKMR